mmetsp:Transcript_19019/g.31118  ORF Transcript_19019/g.31118 Transcript_19019/m.31118 type:complete len:242 (+) Transcript_19019:964-1689(+)
MTNDRNNGQNWRPNNCLSIRMRCPNDGYLLASVSSSSTSDSEPCSISCVSISSRASIFHRVQLSNQVSMYCIPCQPGQNAQNLPGSPKTSRNSLPWPFVLLGALAVLQPSCSHSLSNLPAPSAFCGWRFRFTPRGDFRFTPRGDLRSRYQPGERKRRMVWGYPRQLLVCIQLVRGRIMSCSDKPPTVHYTLPNHPPSHILVRISQSCNDNRTIILSRASVYLNKIGVIELFLSARMLSDAC